MRRRPGIFDVEFQGDSSKILRYNQRLKNALFLQDWLPKRIASIQAEIETRIKINVKLMSETPSPLTNPQELGKGGVTAKLQQNITSGVNRAEKMISAWTGDIKKMDADDPIFLLAKPSRNVGDKVRLWRILQYGTKKYYPIPPRGKFIHYLWRRNNVWITSNTGTKRHPGVRAKRAFTLFKHQLAIYRQAMLHEIDRVFRMYRRSLGGSATV